MLGHVVVPLVAGVAMGVTVTVAVIVAALLHRSRTHVSRRLGERRATGTRSLRLLPDRPPR
jgi:hypothetical protein